MLIRLLLVPILFVYACVFAGGYGAFHNQISFTVSPEYFTQFKFPQFDINDSVSERSGAAIVGCLASWWMGIVIGAVLIPLGLLLIPGTAKQFFWCMIKVFWVVALTTLGVGLVALGTSFLIIDPNMVEEFRPFHNEIVDDVAFARAGMMHNFSYLGGFLGIVTGAIAIFLIRRKHTRSAGPNAT